MKQKPRLRTRKQYTTSQNEKKTQTEYQTSDASKQNKFSKKETQSKHLDEKHDPAITASKDNQF